MTFRYPRQDEELARLAYRLAVACQMVPMYGEHGCIECADPEHTAKCRHGRMIRAASAYERRLFKLEPERLSGVDQTTVAKSGGGL